MNFQESPASMPHISWASTSSGAPTAMALRTMLTGMSATRSAATTMMRTGGKLAIVVLPGLSLHVLAGVWVIVLHQERVADPL